MALASVVFVDTLVLSDAERTLPVVIGCALAAGGAGAAAAVRTIEHRAKAITAAGLGAGSGALAGLVSIATSFVMPRDAVGGEMLLLATAGTMTFFGAVIGALFGLSTLAAVRPAARAEQAPSYDGLERVLLPACTWLAFVGRFALRFQRSRLVLGEAALITVAVTLVLVVARDLRRILWLRAVACGRVAGWSIVADDGSPPPEPPVPMFARYGDDALDGYLVRHGDGDGATPFRRSGAVERVAELPRDLRKAMSPPLRRLALSLLLASVSVWWIRDGLLPPALRP
ncbi:MAG: hypothetical protein QM820_18260 [Minicystis sp.]